MSAAAECRDEDWNLPGSPAAAYCDCPTDEEAANLSLLTPGKRLVCDFLCWDAPWMPLCNFFPDHGTECRACHEDCDPESIEAELCFPCSSYCSWESATIEPGTATASPAPSPQPARTQAPTQAPIQYSPPSRDKDRSSGEEESPPPPSSLPRTPPDYIKLIVVSGSVEVATNDGGAWHESAGQSLRDVIETNGVTKITVSKRRPSASNRRRLLNRSSDGGSESSPPSFTSTWDFEAGVSNASGASALIEQFTNSLFVAEFCAALDAPLEQQARISVSNLTFLQRQSAESETALRSTEQVGTTTSLFCNDAASLEVDGSSFAQALQQEAAPSTAFAAMAVLCLLSALVLLAAAWISSQFILSPPPRSAQVHPVKPQTSGKKEEEAEYDAPTPLPPREEEEVDEEGFFEAISVAPKF